MAGDGGKAGTKRDGWALVVYFLVACIPPWIGWSLLSFGVVSQHAPYAPLLYLTGYGVSIGGIIATGMSEGLGGIRRLLGNAVRLAVPVRWWLYALLLPPVLYACAALLFIVLTGEPVRVYPAALLQLATPGALLPFFFGPFAEELGWRGFLLPALTRRVSVLPACLIVGVIWAIWHWPIEYQVLLVFPGLVWAATCMNFMIGAVYLRTRSLPLAMIMHWSFNSMAPVVPNLFPGLPGPASSPLVQWTEAGVLALGAVLSAPILLAAQREDGLFQRGRRGAPGERQPGVEPLR
jgi:membrane protease YdiL (CAAX protease family)